LWKVQSKVHFMLHIVTVATLRQASVCSLLCIILLAYASTTTNERVPHQDA